MEPTHHFKAVFSTVNLNPIWNLFDKPKKVGAPRELNYGAMVYSLIARVVDRVVTIKDLVRRLDRDPIFRYDCGFLHSYQIPSESFYSRKITVISESDAMAHIHDNLIVLAIDEGHIGEENIAILATQFKAKDRAQAKNSRHRKSADANRKPNVNNG